MGFLKTYGLRLVLILVCNRLLLAGIGAIAIDSFAPHFQKPPEHVFAKSLLLIPWGAWDTGAYMTIVKDGYRSPDGSMVQIGWFPLYPLAIKLMSVLIPDAFIAGLVVSNLFLVGALFLFGAWLAARTDPKTAYHAVLFLIFFPTSMVLSGAFSESIFLFLLAAAFLLLQQKKRMLACVAFSLLLISRPVAISITPFFLFLLCPIPERDWKAWLRALVPALLLPIPLLLFHLYLWHLTGDPLAYVHSKVKYGAVGFSNPLWILFDALRRGIAEHRFEHAFNAGMVLFGTAAVLLNRKTLGLNYVLIGVMLIVFPLFAGESLIPGSSRYVAATLPVFSGLALAGERYSCTEMLFMICLLLQGLVMVMWSLGGRFLV